MYDDFMARLLETRHVIPTLSSGLHKTHACVYTFYILGMAGNGLERDHVMNMLEGSRSVD